MQILKAIQNHTNRSPYIYIYKAIAAQNNIILFSKFLSLSLSLSLCEISLKTTRFCYFAGDISLKTNNIPWFPSRVKVVFFSPSLREVNDKILFGVSDFLFFND